MTKDRAAKLWLAMVALIGCSSGPSDQDASAGPDASPDSASTSSGSTAKSGTPAPSGGGSGTASGSGASSGFSSGSASATTGDDSGTVGSTDSSTVPDGGVLQAGDGGTPGPGPDAAVRQHAGVWRVMPLGDSITGTMCPPQLLSQQLKTNGRTNFVFVGSNLNNQSCYGAPNVQTEGHGGYLVTDLVGPGPHAAELPRWCAADRADVVLMMFGTNDAWNSRPTQFILDAYSVVLADLRQVNPNVVFFVGLVTPLNPSGCANCEANVESLNARIPAWAATESKAASPVYVVDVHSAFTASAYRPGSMYTADGVHPNPAGSKLIADKWYAALIAQGLP